MANRLAQEAAALMGEELASARPMQGGDLSAVVLLRLASGAEAVAKSGPAPLTEAAMLRAIRSAGARAPEVLAVSSTVLVLERLPEGGPVDGAAWADLGRALRALHGATGASYGWEGDYAFGPVVIRNAASDDWPEFWAERRLLSEADRSPADLARRLEALARRLPEFLPQRPAPSLCHGDLWTGNVLFHRGAVSGLIDPAAYHGHAELDLAMLSLFGSIDAAFWEAYGDPEPGWPQRRAIYQLWPAIVHLRLFGAGYRGLVERLLTESLAG